MDLIGRAKLRFCVPGVVRWPGCPASHIHHSIERIRGWSALRRSLSLKKGMHVLCISSGSIRSRQVPKIACLCGASSVGFGLLRIN